MRELQARVPLAGRMRNYLESIMNHTRRFNPLTISVAGLGVAVLLIASTAAARPDSTARNGLGRGATIPGHWIVVLRDNHPDPAGFARQQGHTPSHVYRHALKGYAVQLPDRAVAGLRHNPNVRFVQPDSVVTASVQTLPTGINRIDADTNQQAKIDGVDERVNVDVAIIDTGIDPTHPDLNVVGGVNFTKGKADQWADQNGHGTHCAGTVGALDNGVGVVGVAPGARLWAVRVLDRNGSGATSGVVAGIDWVAANAATIRIANMSLGGSGSDDGNCGNTNNDAEHKAICAAVAAGVTFVVAAGNETDDAANHTPAAYDEVITVSALADFDGLPGGTGSATFAFSSCTENVDDSFACFSNYGADVDIMAPGVGIYSTYKGGTYADSSGTSMAAPHVAGAAALIAAANPGWSPAQVKAKLLADAKPTDFVSDDPDGVHEPLLYVGSAAPAHDLAITSVSAPGSAAPGDVVSVSVTVANQGTFAESSTVSLVDISSGLQIGSQALNLAAGAVTTLTFNWDTTSAGLGSHVLGAEVAAVAGETDTADNASSAVVNLIAPIHDVAVTSVSVAAQVAAGSVAAVTVGVTNPGTFGETFAVTLSDGVATVGSQTISLAAGASTTLTFNWDTAGLALGGYTLTATAAAVAGETALSNNAASAGTTLIQAQTLHASVTTNSPSYKSGATVQITAVVTDGSSPVSGASVGVQIATPKGKVYAGSGTTAADGTVTFNFGTNAKKDGYGTYVVTITATKAAWTSVQVSTSFAVTG